MKSISELKRVHCIGLGGVGVSAVAKLLQSRGVVVSGSDAQRSPLVEDAIRKGIIYYPDEQAKRITNEIELVVATDDAPTQHPQRQAANALGIPIENFSVTLGRLMSDYSTRICIAGTNGKSTTTAMIGLLLAKAKLDPTVVIGSRVKEFDGNLRTGAGKIFVAEADEYRDHFLNLSPTVAVVTNIEADHLDYFETKEKMLASYKKFVRRLPNDGMLVANADDREAMSIAETCHHVVTFGIEQPADVQAIDIDQTSGQQSWTTLWKGKPLGRFALHIPGKFNIMNSLAATAGALGLGAEPSTFAGTLAEFNGIWRRFQILNPTASTTIISDYAHHPSAVDQTLQGAKKFYPGRRIIAVFQPHHRSRLTAMFEEFANSFASADAVIVLETYSVPGRDVPENKSRTSAELVAAIQQEKIPSSYAADMPEAKKQLQELLRPDDVAIIMGAGDVWHMAENITAHYD